MSIQLDNVLQAIAQYLMIIINLVEVIIFSGNEAKVKTRTDRSIVSQRTAELAKLISLVNEELTNSQHQETRFDQDYFMDRNDDKLSVLKNIKLVQNNYDAFKYPVRDVDPLRFYLISNPSVLDRYKQERRLPRVLKTNKNEDPNSQLSLKDYLLDLRRNAVFRLDSSSNENSKTVFTKNIQDSNEKTVYFNTKKSFEKNRAKAEEDIKNDDFPKNDDNGSGRDIKFDDDDKKDNRKKGEHGDEFKENTWDVITKKYDWNDVPQLTNNNDISNKRKDKNIDDDWDKITKQDYDWSRIDKKKAKHDNFNEKQNINWDEKPTKRWKAPKKRDSYVPKVSYNKPKARNRDTFERGGFFGRTPIPFIGKRGIYDD